jgi:anti-anti-sigma factor
VKLEIVRKKAGENKVQLQIAGNMTIYSIKKLKELLLKELKSSSGITLDMSGINEADTSAFQLLLFLKREAEATDRDFHVMNMSSRLQSIFSLYNETI